MLAHQEITGLTTAGDVRLLGMIVRAERERMPLQAAVTALQNDADYASPFLRPPA